MNEGLKPYPCTICEQKFKSPSEVSSHKKINHEEEKKKEESFECQICAAMLKTYTGLLAHRSSIYEFKLYGAE